MTASPARVLVAGIGNVFFGDDGFGPAAVGRIDRSTLPDSVDIADYGIAGVHLAYDLLDARHQSLILVDAAPLGEMPGTLAVIEVDDPGRFGDRLDAHSMSPASVLAAITAVGAPLPRVLLVGCQPARLDPGMELSTPVSAALDEAARLIAEVAIGESSIVERTAVAAGAVGPGEV
jgi:hydrogenase maturation protease